MGVTLNTDWKVHQTELQTGYAESVTQAIDAFFNLSRGAVVLKDEMYRGDYIKRAFTKLPSGLVSRRVTTGTGASATATAVTVSQGEEVNVRLSRKLGPVDLTLDTLRRTGVSPQAASISIGRMLAEATMQKMLSDGCAALRASLNKTASTHDQTALTVKTLKISALVNGLKLMGDRASDIVCWLGHSKPYFDLVNEQTTPSTSVDTVMSNTVYGAQPATLNRPYIVTDEANLWTDATTDSYYVLGLTADALQIIADQTLSEVVSEIVTGQENLLMRIQGERDWAVGVKGYAWDETNGGANPSDAALITGTNWDLAASSFKLGAGVCIKTN